CARFSSDFGGSGLIAQVRGGISVSSQSVGNEGVRGQSGITASSVTRSHTGGHGITDSNLDGAVWGENVGGGPGVKGTASGGGDGVGGVTVSGLGVVGLSTGTGTGVAGLSDGGPGVLAVGAKTALQVQGPAAFSRSGIVTVAAGKSSVRKSGIALRPASFVLA